MKGSLKNSEKNPIPLNNTPRVSENNLREKQVGKKLSNKKKVKGSDSDIKPLRNVPNSMREVKIYCPVLDYGIWAKAIRRFKTGMGKSTQAALDKLAGEFELAASKVDSQLSDYTVLDHIMNEFLVAFSTIPHNDLTSNQNLFLATLADSLADSYEVLALGDAREDKPLLLPPNLWVVV